LGVLVIFYFQAVIDLTAFRLLPSSGVRDLEGPTGWQIQCCIVFICKLSLMQRTIPSVKGLTHLSVDIREESYMANIALRCNGAVYFWSSAIREA
jgi:hypothetical protein